MADTMKVYLTCDGKDYYLGSCGTDDSVDIELISEIGIKDKVSPSVIRYIQAGFAYGYRMAQEQGIKPPRGEWSMTQVLGDPETHIICSNCKDEFIGENELEVWKQAYRYCPSCGACMVPEECSTSESSDTDA